MLRALIGGVLVSVLCAITGTWVVLRGMAFLGEAMAHGMLPGVATAMLLGLPGPLGGIVAAGGMAAGITVVQRRTRTSQDTAIGLLFVGMLALGVIIVSSSRAFPVDLTAILFGDILAMQWPQVLGIAVAAVVTVAFFASMHRPFTALAFDSRVAHTLGLRPRVATYALLAGVALAIVSSYQAVGTLLVVGLLLAPPAAAALWARSIRGVMVLAAGFGALATALGLLVSWHAGTAAGASIALASVLIFALTAVVRRAG